MRQEIAALNSTATSPHGQDANELHKAQHIIDVCCVFIYMDLKVSLLLLLSNYSVT